MCTVATVFTRPCSKKILKIWIFAASLEWIQVVGLAAPPVNLTMWSNAFWSCILIKKKIFKKIACIQSHHLHLQWKFKLLAGKFTWVVKAKHCWVMSTNFLFSKVCWQHLAMFCLYNSCELSPNNLNFHWRWRWWDWIQAIFFNLFYFNLIILI